MNDRIKDLAERAFEPINAMASEGIADRHTFEQAWFQEYNNSFAELVVNECVALLQPNNDRVADANVDMLKSKIKQHFGVEE